MSVALGATSATWLALSLAVVSLPATSRASARARAMSARHEVTGPVAPSARGLPPVAPRIVAAAAVGLVAVGVGLAGGPVLAVAGAAAAATAAWLLLAAARRRAEVRAQTELLGVLHVLAGELAAGAMPVEALGGAAEVATALRAELLRAAEACRGGEDPQLEHPALAGLAHAWRVAGATGAPLADVVHRVAGDVAARAEQRRAVEGAVAGARSSAALLAVLPAVGLLLGGAMQARPLDVLVGSPAGRLLCLLGVLLDAAGLLWTHRLAARAMRP